jgi:hypothetical protein
MMQPVSFIHKNTKYGWIIKICQSHQMISGSAKFIAFCILKNIRKKTEFENQKSKIYIPNQATLFSWLEFLLTVKKKKIKREK